MTDEEYRKAKRDELAEDLRQVINKHSLENASGTPDFLLAEMFMAHLDIYNISIAARAQWRGESTELPALQNHTLEGPNEISAV